ncbi:leucine-rich repeat protein soc-2 homolog isoform X2 [Condylostylus longicornis]|uniref:leucine-rich repeat protein soc-2 homolog isoform X2 n=1 Tax=Condylostylus longicornis TaxID=2530218 RepID=UPI00244E2CCD|nr:leucine-rich repeat protein soc-2 homolog isoform X2 [Condylostylus longicornis]
MNKCTTLHWSYRDFTNVPIDLLYYEETPEEIYLKENFLTSIPAWLLQLNNIKFLHLTGIGQLKKLECLDLSENPIKTLPVEISECSRLLELFLNGLAELLYIPDRIANMRTLQTLSADRCGLLYLPASISKFIAHVRMFNNLQITHIPIAYEKHFTSFYQQVQNVPRTTIDPYLFLIREKETNKILLLPIGTLKVFPIPSCENSVTLYDHALRCINYMNHFISIHKHNEILNTLPTVAMKNHIKNGPISMCNFCTKLLYTSYYLMVVKRRNSTSKVIFTCNFCSMFCSNYWMSDNKAKYYPVEWEICDN